MRFDFRILAAVVIAGCAPESERAPVRATLSDGQVMAGDVTTPFLRLEGGLGLLEIPLEDVGEVTPVEGGHLGGAHGNVTVWLRNGTELVGRWADPELQIDLSIGGDLVPVDLPMDDLTRFQTTGAQLWPDDLVYRVRTTHGDDLLVDADSSRIVIENELGVFAPFLSECASARPVAEPTGDWRVELVSGTVLIGPLAEDAIAFSLPLGPGTVEVPLTAFVSMERQDWTYAVDEVRSSAPAASPSTPMPSEQGGSGSADWFDNADYRAVKQKMH